MPLVRALRKATTTTRRGYGRKICLIGPVFLLASSACGAPFESGIGPAPHEGGADVVLRDPDPDAGVEGGRGDAGVDARPSDAAREARVHHEGGADVALDAPPADTAPPKDAAPGDVAPEACALPPASLDVCGGMPAGGVEYCIQLGGGTSDPHTVTPAACRCLADYTCACVLAEAADPCAGHGSLVDCLIYDGVPVVRCN
jgi:hypothetical protein